MIEVKGLYKDFGALHVLRGVSLNVEQGDIISIIGAGSGFPKTACALVSSDYGKSDDGGTKNAGTNQSNSRPNVGYSGNPGY